MFCFCCCCLVTKSCLTLCDPMDCSTPGFPVLPCLLEFAQTHVHWVGDAIQLSYPLLPFSSCSQSFPASGSFSMSWLFASSGQSIGAPASVLPRNIQGWFCLGWTSLISLLSKALSRIFSSTKIKSINFSALSLLYGPTLKSVQNYLYFRNPLPKINSK